MSGATALKDHSRCQRIRMCLFEVGLDPDRMMCTDDAVCGVASGLGTEGKSIEEVDRLTDRAIALAGGGA